MESFIEKFNKLKSLEGKIVRFTCNLSKTIQVCKIKSIESKYNSEQSIRFVLDNDTSFLFPLPLEVVEVGNKTLICKGHEKQRTEEMYRVGRKQRLVTRNLTPSLELKIEILN